MPTIGGILPGIAAELVAPNDRGNEAAPLQLIAGKTPSGEDRQHPKAQLVRFERKQGIRVGDQIDEFHRSHAAEFAQTPTMRRAINPVPQACLCGL